MDGNVPRWARGAAARVRDAYVPGAPVSLGCVYVCRLWVGRSPWGVRLNTGGTKWPREPRPRRLRHGYDLCTPPAPDTGAEHVLRREPREGRVFHGWGAARPPGPPPDSIRPLGRRGRSRQRAEGQRARRTARLHPAGSCHPLSRADCMGAVPALLSSPPPLPLLPLPPSAALRGAVRRTSPGAEQEARRVRFGDGKGGCASSLSRHARVRPLSVATAPPTRWSQMPPKVCQRRQQSRQHRASHLLVRTFSARHTEWGDVEIDAVAHQSWVP